MGRFRSMGTLFLVAALAAPGCTMSSDAFVAHLERATAERDESAMLDAMDRQVFSHDARGTANFAAMIVASRARSKMLAGDRRPVAATVGKVVVEADRRGAPYALTYGWEYMDGLVSLDASNDEFVDSELRAIIVTWPDAFLIRHAVALARTGNARRLTTMLQAARPELATAMCKKEAAGTRAIDVARTEPMRTLLLECGAKERSAEEWKQARKDFEVERREAEEEARRQARRDKEDQERQRLASMSPEERRRENIRQVEADLRRDTMERSFDPPAQRAPRPSTPRGNGEREQVAESNPAPTPATPPSSSGFGTSASSGSARTPSPREERSEPNVVAPDVGPSTSTPTTTMKPSPRPAPSPSPSPAARPSAPKPTAPPPAARPATTGAAPDSESTRAAQWAAAFEAGGGKSPPPPPPQPKVVPCNRAEYSDSLTRDSWVAYPTRDEATYYALSKANGAADEVCTKRPLPKATCDDAWLKRRTAPDPYVTCTTTPNGQFKCTAKIEFWCECTRCKQ